MLGLAGFVGAVPDSRFRAQQLVIMFDDLGSRNRHAHWAGISALIVRLCFGRRLRSITRRQSFASVRLLSLWPFVSSLVIQQDRLFNVVRLYAWFALFAVGGLCPVRRDSWPVVLSVE